VPQRNWAQSRCCFAIKDKVWVTGPGGERWEVYTVLTDAEIFGAAPQATGNSDESVCRCCGMG
jgi:hypothetical protein